MRIAHRKAVKTGENRGSRKNIFNKKQRLHISAMRNATPVYGIGRRENPAGLSMSQGQAGPDPSRGKPDSAKIAEKGRVAPPGEPPSPCKTNCTPFVCRICCTNLMENCCDKNFNFQLTFSPGQYYWCLFTIHHKRRIICLS